MKSSKSDVVLDTYSAQAEVYDDRGNVDSCWGIDTRSIIESIVIKDRYRTVVDVGCGTGVALLPLASTAGPDVRFVGVEPAGNMRRRAEELCGHLRNVRIVEGAFDNIPLEDGSVDYMYSINAFHWSPNLDATMEEMARVLGREGEMDHFFIGRDIGREFIRKTTPIFMRYMGPKALLEAATMRHNLTVAEARGLFEEAFTPERVRVDERYDTYYDTVEGHLGWWVRIEPQLLGIPEDRRADCEREVRAALASLATERGVPYTKHTIHARVREGNR